MESIQEKILAKQTEPEFIDQKAESINPHFLIQELSKLKGRINRPSIRKLILKGVYVNSVQVICYKDHHLQFKSISNFLGLIYWVGLFAKEDPTPNEIPQTLNP